MKQLEGNSFFVGFRSTQPTFFSVYTANLVGWVEERNPTIMIAQNCVLIV